MPSEHARASDREELLELLFANVAEAMALVEPNGRIVEVNPAACAMLGRGKSDIVGTYPWDFVTSASRDEILEALGRVEPSGPASVQCTYRRISGELGTMDVRLSRLGCPRRDWLIASCRDITEEKRLQARWSDASERESAAEELQRLNAELLQQASHLREINQTLLDSEQRLRLAIETGRIGLWVWNSTDLGNVGDWSQRMKEIFGLPLDAEVTHDMFLKCVHPDDRTRVDSSVMQALAGANGGEYRTEYRTIHPRDGSVQWVTARGQAFFDADGQAIRFIGTVMDITERKRAEEASARLNMELERRIRERTADLERINQAFRVEIEERRKSEASLTRTQRLTQTGSATWILSTRKLLWSDETYRLFELPPDTKLTPELVASRVHPEDLPLYLQAFSGKGEDLHFGHRLVMPDGYIKYVEVYATALRDDAGQIIEWAGALRDVTSIKRSAEALQASEHLARGQFAALTRTLDVLAQESNPERLLEHVLRMIAGRLNGQSVSVYERNGESSEMDMVATFEDDRLHAPSKDLSSVKRVTLFTEDHPVWSEALRTGVDIVVGEIDCDPPRIRLGSRENSPWYPWHGDMPHDPNMSVIYKRLAAMGVVATLTVPTLIGGKLAGFIGIRSRHKNLFQTSEMELARALAHQAMLAIQLMRLSRQSREAAIAAERNRMARDLHDTLAQGFTGVIVQLEATEDAWSRGLLPEAGKHLVRAQELARGSLQEARRSAHALRSQALAEKSLSEAMGDLIKKMTSGTSVVGVFTLEGSPWPLSNEWEENLLRIGQEVLTNTLRHARARHFNARLAFEPHRLRFELRDDGLGFDPSAQNEGLGLIGIKERVEVMGGQLTIRSAEGSGTAIVASLPAPYPYDDFTL
ncbi:sensor histidine kinase [Polyangium jinanense]|uniref:Oxygen sensor histidine kinase NreB n=1 Tax=Polyangium jinanense TaxID=2829994 RepID=A0A9X3XH90_9BACT|nr:PAS domain S-box protein [Polyangium jinanense]MDC3959778.1 PAS domain S-box protein [Polyangium jinanense]MDC3988076.1 PAS domain S-box protein [Polyangium jinanense]